MSQEWTHVFPCTTEGLAAGTAFLEQELERVECPAKLSTKFMIAFDEMGSNVVHYSGSPDYAIEVSRADGKVLVHIADPGIAYNPLEKEDPDVTQSAEERKIGGLGIFMTKKLMSDVQYARISGRNVVTLVQVVE